MAVPVELEIFMRDLTKAGLQSVAGNVEGVKSQTRRLIAALEQARAEQLNQLTAAKKVGLSYTTEAANVQALTGQINGLKAGLKELQKEQAAAGGTKIDIDTEAVERKTNNLRMQFSQVARELPSLAMGPQMFILAISNNLPMLADAIADVRKQNELLNASGQKGVPVWRQLLGACMSWQTALIAAISVGIMFGKDIANWAKGLLNGKKAFDELKKAQEDYNKEMLTQQQHAQTETVTLKLLYDAATDAAGGMKERTDAVKELKKEYPDYFKNLTDEEILTGKAADSYMRLTESIMASARAQAARNSIVEQQGKVLENEQKINEAYIRLGEAQRKTSELRAYLDKQREEGAAASSLLNTEVAITMAETAEKKIEKEIAGYRRAVYQANKVSKELEKGINVSDLIFDSKGTSGGTPTGSGNTQSGEKDYAAKLAGARLRAERETERLRIQIQQEGFDRRRALARQEYEETLADIDRLQKDTTAEMDRARAEGGIIPQSQYDTVNEEADRQRIVAREKLNLQLQQIDKEYNEQAAQDLIDYNKQYGTYADKRLAIAQDYARKIIAAETDGEKQALARQMKQALAELDFSQFRGAIDWETVFNDLDSLSAEYLQRLKAQLQEALSMDDISAENAKVLAERIDEINGKLIEKQNEWRSAFGLVIPELEEIRRRQEEAAAAQCRVTEAAEAYNRALQEVAETQRIISGELAAGGIRADASAITSAGGADFISQFQSLGRDTKNLTSLFSKLGKQEQGLAMQTDKLTAAQGKSAVATQKAGGSAASTVAIIDTIIHAINDNIQSSVQLINELGVADTKFGKAFTTFAESSQYATDAWESLKSGNIAGVATGVLGSLRTLGETLGQLGVRGFGSSDPYLEEDIERLTFANQELEKAITNLSEKMEGAAVADASQIYAVQRENLLKQMANTQESMERSASASSNGFLGIGGHHSTDYKINRGMTDADWRAISEAAGRNVASSNDFFKLSSEEMWRVANEATTEYAKLKALADDGYKDAAQFMDEYIGYWKELEELQDEYNEKLTSVSFDSVRDSYKNLLLDMGSDTEDFMSDFEKMMQSAILESMISSKYDTLLKGWYEDFAEAMEDGRMSRQEQRQLETLWNSIAEQGLAERDALKELFGWQADNEESGSSQSPTTGALTTMSQDSISRFEGIGRSMQTHLINIDKSVADLRASAKLSNETLATIAGHTAYIVHIYELVEYMKVNGIKVQ